MNDKYLKARSLEYFSRCTFSQKPDNFVEVLNFCMRLHKLRSQLRGSFFIWFHFGSAYMIYFIYIYHIHLFHGNIWTHNWPAPNSSGFIAQLVWASHRYRVSQSSFLYFISRVCISVRLNLLSKSLKQIVSLNLVHYFHTCAIFWLEYSILCTPAPKVPVREYIFQPHIFCIL